MTSISKPSVERMRESLESIFADNKFVVFLCGPTLSAEKPTSGSQLRASLEHHLLSEGFEVVLGEDAGLEELRKKYNGLADHNELSFIQQESSAIVLVADSVGSYCELGLFSYEHTMDRLPDTDFILLIKDKFQGVTSYLNEGPAKAVEHIGGKVFYCDFDNFNPAPLIERLKVRRNVWFKSGKGRPVGSGK